LIAFILAFKLSFISLTVVSHNVPYVTVSIHNQQTADIVLYIVYDNEEHNSFLQTTIIIHACKLCVHTHMYKYVQAVCIYTGSKRLSSVRSYCTVCVPCKLHFRNGNCYHFLVLVGTVGDMLFELTRTLYSGY